MEGLEDEHTVTEVTRRVILDTIASTWPGKLNEVDFLSRLYNLDDLRSHDSRFRTAADDIWQHTILNPSDWEPDWVFTDSRFNVLRGSDEGFLNFISETLHPLVRDQEEAKGLAETFNVDLAKDGWQLVPIRLVSGRPVYGPVSHDFRVLSNEPTGWPKVDRQLGEARQRLREAEHEEQFQAVGLLCREIIISVAQATYDVSRYPPVTDVVPSQTDAYRMIENIVAVELAGGAFEEARSYAKAALKLAVAVQHDRTPDKKTAAFCLEAAFSIVNIIAILTGRTSPPSS